MRGKGRPSLDTILYCFLGETWGVAGTKDASKYPASLSNVFYCFAVWPVCKILWFFYLGCSPMFFETAKQPSEGQVLCFPRVIFNFICCNFNDRAATTASAFRFLKLYWPTAAWELALLHLWANCRCSTIRNWCNLHTQQIYFLYKQWSKN